MQEQVYNLTMILSNFFNKYIDSFFVKYTDRQKKRVIMISLINDLEIIFVLIFLYYM
jgi:hypothetical protein